MNPVSAYIKRKQGFVVFYASIYLIFATFSKPLDNFL